MKVSRVLVEEAKTEPETQTVKSHQRKKSVRKTLSDDLPCDALPLYRQEFIL